MMSEERNSDYSREQFREERKRRDREQREYRDKMRWERHIQRCDMHHDRKGWFGLLIILIGLAWLLKSTAAFPMPEWLFSWPMLWIAIGIFTGIASRFRNPIAAVLILIGAAFLLRDFIYPEVDLDKYIWPCVVIAFGIMFLVKKRGIDKRREWVMKHHPEWQDWRSQWYQKWHYQHSGPYDEQENRSQAGDRTFAGYSGDRPYKPETDETPPPSPVPQFTHKDTFNKNDWIDITTVFGGTRRTVISKHFNGGDVVTVCGGTEIDLTRSDIQGNAIIDMVGIWGGIRIAVPPNWQVRLNFTNIMAGTDDRRTKDIEPDPNKVLTLTGTMLMAGIEIRDAL